MAREFWRSAGLRLCQRRADGWLAPTPALLRAYLTRPEVHPIDTSCAEEVRLHEALMDDPALAVAPERLARLADADAAENYRAVLALRDLLLAAGSIEAAYLGLARAGQVSVPPVFMDQLVHLILRNALEGTTDPMRLRAAELFLREQTVSTDGGRILLADDEIVAQRAAGGKSGVAQLLAETGVPARQVTLDVLSEANKELYWDRSDSFDTVIDFRLGQPAPDAFARVVETWLSHLMRIEARVQPVARIDDPDWRWHVGLDRESNAILNALFEGRDPGLEAMQRIIGLFRMRVDDDRVLIDRVKGRPIHLGLAMSPAGKLRVKPQNLIVNLPLRAPS